MTYAATATQTAAHLARRIFSKEERSAWARQGAQALHQRYNAQETTQKARESFLNRFYYLVDPQWQLLPHVRAIRVEAAKRAYFTELAITRWKKQQSEHDSTRAATSDERYACSACCKEAGQSFPQGRSGRLCGWHKLLLKQAMYNDIATYGGGDEVDSLASA